MRKSLQKLLGSIVFVCCGCISGSYAQETNMSLVVVPVKSTMLSDAIMERQLKLEVQQIEALDEVTRDSLYQSLPNRFDDEVQSRTMTWQTQNACRGVYKMYEVNISNIVTGTAYSFWDFGDGSPIERDRILGFQGTSRMPHIYETPGMYTITIGFYNESNLPSGEPSKQIKVNVEVCPPLVAPQFSVNPNIHKVGR